MSGLTITFDGLDKALRDIKKYSEETQTKIGTEVKATAFDIVSEAQVSAPVDMGYLRNSIKVGEVSKLNAEALVTADYAPYVEFGTGGLTDVPKGLEGYASRFKGKGIKQVNLPARPFFFPAVFKNSKLLVERLKKLL